MEVFLKVVTILAAVAGFLLAYYIRHKKHHEQPMVCPLNSDCHKVVHSEYSRFFGIPVELLGILYYLIIGVAYLVFLVKPEIYFPALSTLILLITSLAFLFSLYLTAIQLFVIRELCTWCLISAFICTVIFIAGWYLSGFSLDAPLSDFASFS
ncbi:MAG: hypothetical protein A2836_01670 [Candidatus Taylorbacteria bacterium RIFCSPHIGHO2_01_FULL_45_63]|uniref:Vitamin K epoxide reductase domain-containing protein n=1 Tax=Candidatus Taylorbacteria bacterium RIFCSPHIGHO2_02_FULL_45_35 TaxID=1802311 RepID=A0A1G2MRY9_9BACT|nr:MAG: hypothetical protein A2836_01670 [Candidatus Taylorbacteria bacterium RIFCSPHIGHO2_01_FULL_45_63]OHA26667.1 MAG: hypothetical protein A3D56_02575 [Candidatus Taylorbacteria bacterium RIFCSPHIGHO2_02_FULL_45_35]OHA32581.1 MAG: hypothetical protein A3A22_01885 [Candidatus Taylorbacteria bacterium RIFCSPLOWO2_01_FULL_45_34b]